MFRCSACTAGFTEYFNPNSSCSKCNTVLEHICGVCKRTSHGGLLSMTCYKCQPHICLSKCSSGCVLQSRLPVPRCECTDGRCPNRFRVTKEGTNKGRWFFTCRACGFFAFDDTHS